MRRYEAVLEEARAVTSLATRTNTTDTTIASTGTDTTTAEALAEAAAGGLRRLHELLDSVVRTVHRRERRLWKRSFWMGQVLHDYLQSVHRDIEFAALPTSLYHTQGTGPFTSFPIHDHHTIGEDDDDDDCVGDDDDQKDNNKQHQPPTPPQEEEPHEELPSLQWRDVLDRVKEMKADVRSIKGMLLSRRNFPALQDVGSGGSSSGGSSSGGVNQLLPATITTRTVSSTAATAPSTFPAAISPSPSVLVSS